MHGEPRGDMRSPTYALRTRAFPRLPTRARRSGDPDHHLSELLAPLQPREGLRSLLERKDGVDDGCEPPRPQLPGDGVELVVVAHRGPHDRPLVPEEPPHVGTELVTARATAGHQPAAASERL